MIRPVAFQQRKAPSEGTGAFLLKTMMESRLTGSLGLPIAIR